MKNAQPFNYHRRPTLSVAVGNVTIGGDAPIAVQSMTNTSTDDIEASEAQCLRIAKAGAALVRLTAQGVREAEAIGVIRKRLRSQGCEVPLVADIHFNPKAAFAAAQVTDKVRINPGNFVDPARQFKALTYTDAEYAAELQRITEALTPFIDICRNHGTAVRLGVNHGSLSDRIMSRYGNTPAGMVESVMEFLRVFVEQKFFNVVISMKASNVVVMVEAVRRLVAAMDAEDMHFPLHLGVTEAGFGEDGRIKSAVGIGTLLAEGLGDTIRVSLSEEPECEVPVAKRLVEYYGQRVSHAPIEGSYSSGYDAIAPQRRRSRSVAGLVGGDCKPVVVGMGSPREIPGDVKPDIYFDPMGKPDGVNPTIVPAKKYHGVAKSYPLIGPKFTAADLSGDAPVKWVMVYDYAREEQLNLLRDRDDIVIALIPKNINITGCAQAFMHRLIDAGIDCPVVPWFTYDGHDLGDAQLRASADMGTMLLNGFTDGVWIDFAQIGDFDAMVQTSFAILQAARLRMSKTEFISCPGCGRTLFDLQRTVVSVKQATSHLKHLKIGVMGCIVNGPGEMADADYGYVGAAKGKISLYKGKTCVEKNIPEDEAIERLTLLIKQCGDWVEPNEV